MILLLGRAAMFMNTAREAERKSAENSTTPKLLDQLYMTKRGMFLKLGEQLIQIRALSHDEQGYYVDQREVTCPNGHVGIKRVGRVWYCMNGQCPYFIGENF